VRTASNSEEGLRLVGNPSRTYLARNRLMEEAISSRCVSSAVELVGIDPCWNAVVGLPGLSGQQS
jgi:hypothetical protein